MAALLTQVAGSLSSIDMEGRVVVAALLMQVTGWWLSLQVAGDGCIIDTVAGWLSLSSKCTVVNVDQWMDGDGDLTGGGCECVWWVVNEVVVGDTRWLHVKTGSLPILSFGGSGGQGTV